MDLQALRTTFSNGYGQNKHMKDERSHKEQKHYCNSINENTAGGYRVPAANMCSHIIGHLVCECVAERLLRRACTTRTLVILHS